LGDLDGSVSEDVNSIHSTDPNTSSCSICLDAFQIGDTVMWSRSDVCRHVFHADCIREWFMNPKHEDCPTCRTQVVDFNQLDETSEVDNSDAGPLFMVIDGLVMTVSSPASWIIGEGHIDEPSRFQISFGRISSGMLNQLAESSALDSEDEESIEDVENPIPFRRTMSEGEGSCPRSLSGGRCACICDSSSSRIISRRLSSNSTLSSSMNDETTDNIEELKSPQELRRTFSDGSPSTDLRQEISRRALFAARAFGLSNGRYAKVTQGTDVEDDEYNLRATDDSWTEDDENSLTPQGSTLLPTSDESGDSLC
jgi:hypothetical protein